MYTFVLSEQFLGVGEQKVFEDYLRYKNIENNIWQVFASLFKSRVNNGVPMVLRAYEKEELCGAIILTKCYKYGKALFNNRLFSGLINASNIPYLQWIKFGCCMDMMSNEGFFKNPEKSDEIVASAIDHLNKNFFLTIITDYSHNAGLYKKGSVLPALPHAIIDCSEMKTIQDYTRKFKNLKRKLRVFHKKGGEFILQDRRMHKEQLMSLEKCFIATSENSVFYLPYQDLYLKAALTTSNTKIDKIYYFIARINGEFIGYQAVIKTGKYLNALHGAFDRNLNTNYHAYDILFVKMTEFAIENGIEMCDFGAVLNQTKQRMVNTTIDMSYFILSKYSLIKCLFKIFLKTTKIQSKKQLKFRR